jgi:hypothetical protein
MKTRTKSQIYLSMAAMILTAAVAVAAQQVPFKGAFDGQDTLLSDPSAAPVLFDSTGPSLHRVQFAENVNSRAEKRGRVEVFGATSPSTWQTGSAGTKRQRFECLAREAQSRGVHSSVARTDSSKGWRREGWTPRRIGVETREPRLHPRGQTSPPVAEPPPGRDAASQGRALL